MEPDRQVSVPKPDWPLDEDWLLSQAETPELPVHEYIRILERKSASEGDSTNADEWASVLRDALAEKGRLAEALTILHWQAMRVPDTSADRANIGKAAAAILEHSPEYRRLVDHVGFDKPLPPVECVRRLLLLLSLHPGVLCYDKTWGIGRISDVDFFYARVRIDFERRPQHEMAFGYAAESLMLLDENHVLAEIYRDRNDAKRKALDAPGDLLRRLLTSMGPLNVEELQSLLVPRLFSDAEWKAFWEKARRSIKDDPRFELPKKRKDPLQFHEKPYNRTERWYAELQNERDIPTLLDRLEDVLKGNMPCETPDQRAILIDRLKFALCGCRSHEWGLLAQTVVSAERLGFLAEIADPNELLNSFLQETHFLAATHSLSARWVSDFFHWIHKNRPEEFLSLLLRLLPRLGYPALNEAVDLLIQSGREEDVAAAFRRAFTTQEIEVEFLYWLARHPAEMQRWQVGSRAALLRLILLNLHRTYSGEALKVQNQLRAKVEQPDFLAETMAEMNHDQRVEALQLVRDCRNWDSLDRQAVLGHMIRLYPELAEHAVAPSRSAPRETPRVTSWRSYVERQKQLEKLITVDIPQNSREIAIARSYGDLSENHEYKAAKEMQGILLKRRGELELLLQSVHPTDFQGVPTDRVRPGTSVTLRRADGDTVCYHVLGEWDQDPTLNVIASASPLGKALEGHVVGDQVEIPNEHGPITCVIERISELPEEIRAWAREGGPTA